MTTTNHALTGALIATVIKQPYLAIPLAFASHFVCDAIPYFGINMKFGSRAMYTWLVVDGMAALLMAGILLISGVRNPVLMAVCGFAAMSPDLAWLMYGLKGDHTKVYKHDFISKLHIKIQWYQKVPGILIEFVWAALMLCLIIRLQ